MTAERKPPFAQALDAHVLSLNSHVEVSSLMHWLHFVGLTATVMPEAFETVYTESYSEDPDDAASRWVAVKDQYLDADQYLFTIRELVYCRVVDRFLYYIKMIVQCIFEARPELLPQNAKVRVSDVVGAGSIEKLMLARAEIEARALSFRSDDLLDKAWALLGLESSTRIGVQESVALRNLLVHHNGLVTEDMANRYGAYRDMRGRSVTISEPVLDSLMESIDTLRDQIDERLQERYGFSAARTLEIADEYLRGRQDQQGGRLTSAST